jgi:hypothetical protein
VPSIAGSRVRPIGALGPRSALSRLSGANAEDVHAAGEFDLYTRRLAEVAMAYLVTASSVLRNRFVGAQRRCVWGGAI